MTITRLALAGGVLALTAQSTQAAPKKPTGSRSNIIFVLVDDMGVGDLGVFFQNQRAAAADKSKPWQYTPNLDKFAKEGAQFTDQYCGAPVCAPSRASLLSGRSQGHTSVRDNQFDKALGDNYTIASVLKEQGYATAAFGKWGMQGKTKGKKRKKKKHSSDSPLSLTIQDSWGWVAQPCDRGFDYFLGYMRHKDGHEHYPKEGVYRGKTQVWLNKTNISDKLDKCYTADLWTAAAKHWITEHEKKNPRQPFFVYLAYDTPHAVLELPPCPYPSGGGLNGGIQWLGEPGHWLNTATGKVDSWTHPDYAKATWDDDKDPNTPEVPWPKVYQRYATSVRRIDTAIGDIIQLLKDLKIDDNTLIVFSSDNGPTKESYLSLKKFDKFTPEFFRSYAQFDGIKRDCLEGGIRMPVLARWPRYVKPGTVINTPSMLFDWLPTFSQIAGKPAPAVTDGVSLLPVLTGQGKQHPSTIYVEYKNGSKTPDYQDFVPEHRGRKRGQMQMIRFGDYVGVRYNIKAADDDFEIYNIRKDPQEKNNLARSPEMAEMQKQMKARVLQVRIPNPSAKRPYDNTPLPPAENIGSTEPGVSYSVYSGDYPWVPDTSDMTPIKTGVTQTIAPLKDAGTVVRFRGFIDVKNGGMYKFQLTADGKASLRIHKALLIDADYHYKSGTPKGGQMQLAPGKHPFTLTWLRPSPQATISFKWSKNKNPLQPIPAEALSH